LNISFIANLFDAFNGCLLTFTALWLVLRKNIVVFDFFLRKMHNDSWRRVAGSL